MYHRALEISNALKRKSVFLLGPRQTGKSTLLRARFPDARYVDLLEADTFRELSAFPESLRQRMTPRERLVIIDEIQKLPRLLDEVQLLIDRNPQLRFLLTGSSARKLRHGNANLLGGRALFHALHPLTSAEVGVARSLDLCQWGGLPAMLDSPDPRADLNAYVGTYLKEEIQAESLSRSIENFARVLHFAAHLNGQQVNYTKVGNDAQVPPRTVRDYFQVFQDTLIGYLLPPLAGTSRRKAVATEKFYFFDVGVARSLARKGPLSHATPDFGEALEHLVFLELLAYRDYRDPDLDLTYWRTTSQLEVDFVLNREVAVEVKASARVSPGDLKGIRALSEDLPLRRKLVVSGEPHERWVDDIRILPHQTFLEELWSGALLGDHPQQPREP